MFKLLVIGNQNQNQTNPHTTTTTTTTANYQLPIRTNYSPSPASTTMRSQVFATNLLASRSNTATYCNTHHWARDNQRMPPHSKATVALATWTIENDHGCSYPNSGEIIYLDPPCAVRTSSRFPDTSAGVDMLPSFRSRKFHPGDIRFRTCIRRVVRIDHRR